MWQIWRAQNLERGGGILRWRRLHEFADACAGIVVHEQPVRPRLETGKQSRRWAYVDYSLEEIVETGNRISLLPEAGTARPNDRELLFDGFTLDGPISGSLTPFSAKYLPVHSRNRSRPASYVFRERMTMQ